MIKQFRQRYTTAGLRSSLLNVRREIKIFRKHRKGIRLAKEFIGQQSLRLHVGCGSKIKHDFINIDFTSQADIALDMREPFPFLDNSCSIIYSEHFLEHLDYPESTHSFLKECFRILEPGCLFSVGVPDTAWPIAEYSRQRNEGYFRIVKEGGHPSWCQTEMEHLNFHFRNDEEHRFAYDFHTLAHALTKAGFENVQRRDFDPTLDSEDRHLGPLYADASKPK